GGTDDHLVDERVGESLHLNELALARALAFDSHLLAARAGISTDHRGAGVAGEDRRRELERDRVDVEAREHVDPGIPEIQRVEDGAEIDVERIVTLTGEDADSAREVVG